MAAIADFRDEVRAGRSAFVRAHTGLFLLHAAAEAAGSETPGEASGKPLAFRTSFMNLAGGDEPGLAEYAIMPVCKRAGHPFSDRISVGRAPNCDMVLRLSYVSKLHAHFVAQPDGTLQIVDAGSANGTATNSRLLHPGEVVPLHMNDRIRLGSIEFVLSSAADLFDALLPLLR